MKIISNTVNSTQKKPAMHLKQKASTAGMCYCRRIVSNPYKASAAGYMYMLYCTCLSGPGLSPGWGHCVDCILGQDTLLSSASLHPGVQANLMLGVPCDGLGSNLSGGRGGGTV